MCEEGKAELSLSSSLFPTKEVTDPAPPQAGPVSPKPLPCVWPPRLGPCSVWGLYRVLSQCLGRASSSVFPFFSSFQMEVGGQHLSQA